MSHNNNADKKQDAVPNPDKKVERPKVDTDALAKSVKEKERIIRNNEIVKK